MERKKPKNSAETMQTAENPNASLRGVCACIVCVCMSGVHVCVYVCVCMHCVCVYTLCVCMSGVHALCVHALCVCV